jgi:phospholipid/cholesterol/gamma-HCH transport system substrate-binding protein
VPVSPARKLPKKAINVITAVVALAVVAGAVLFFVLSGGPQKKVTARFTSAVGVYSGTPVKLLGIDVGKVTGVHPDGATVTVDMAYDSKYRLPKNAIAVVVANSLVSDRYIQLAPAYSGRGPTLADGAVIPPDRTAAPAELDDIYSALNKLSISLGPKGANKNGSLRQLVNVGAANLQGNGAALGTSITKLSAAARTLAAGRGDLFGTVKNLQAFTKALSESDAQVRHFNQQLAAVAGELADERSDLGAALHNLGDAINQVAGFVKTNAGRTKTDISELKTLTDVLVHQQGSLNETLAVAPVALANIVHAYQPDLGVIATRSNLASLIDPATLCALLDPSLIPGVPDTVTSPLGPVSAPIKKTCAGVLSKIPLSKLLGQLGLPATLNGGDVGGAINGLVGGLTGPGLGGIITGGG